MNKITFEEGINTLVRKITEATQQQNTPFIISIHGYPNAGKTELVKRMHEVMAKKGIPGISTKCDWPKKYIPHIDSPKYFLIEDLAEKFTSINYAQKLYKKTPDMSIFIARSYAPKDFSIAVLDEYTKEGYDLFIVNPMARIK